MCKVEDGTLLRMRLIESSKRSGTFDSCKDMVKTGMVKLELLQCFLDQGIWDGLMYTDPFDMPRVKNES